MVPPPMLPGHQSQPELGARKSPVSTINMALRRTCRWSARKPSRFRGIFSLPSHVFTLNKSKSQQSIKTCATVCGASPHWHTSVSLTRMLCRYAPSRIFPVRIWMSTVCSFGGLCGILRLLPLVQRSDVLLGSSLSCDVGVSHLAVILGTAG